MLGHQAYPDSRLEASGIHGKASVLFRKGKETEFSDCDCVLWSLLCDLIEVILKLRGWMSLLC